MKTMTTEFDHAHSRREDPQTSHEAAASVDGLNKKQKAVLSVFKEIAPNEISDWDLFLVYDQRQFNGNLPRQSESGLRTRRHELVVKGLLIDSGHRGQTPSGRNTILWRLK